MKERGTMYYTSEADTDLDDRVKRLDNMLEKERKKLNREFFLLPVILVLAVAGVAWKLMKPGMSTYDSTVVLVVFLMAGFLTVLSMLAFVLLRLKHVLNWMEHLQEAIEWIDEKTSLPEVDLSSLPEIDLSSDD